MSPFKKAKRRFNENRINEAIELYKQCIKENICIADSYINMAQCYIELNKNQEAIVVLEVGLIKLFKIFNRFFNKIFMTIFYNQFKIF